MPSRLKVAYTPSRGRSGAEAALEDYLEVINLLIREKGYVSQTDVAERLGVSRPSVSIMLQRLGEKGYVDHVKYRGIALTERGRDLAERMEERHRMLAEFLILIGVDRNTAFEDAENIEHHLHPVTLERIASLVQKLKEDKL
ncbi:MAG: winged helix-turn-helix transcriptional regulator [Nitrososphaerota archaeon]|nr:winged helix-turn-helix transcriptional regulator [Nitrososphaerota archaeon]